VEPFLSLSSAMFMSRVYVATVALLSLHSFASASPLVARAVQGAWNPPVTAPKAGDVWTVRSTQLVTWATDEIPPSSANSTGTLLLGYFDGYSQGENLDIEHPLASGFLLADGCVHVEVPDVSPRDNYIVVLMGNSGNASPEFTISKRRSTSQTTYDRVTSKKASNSLGPRQLFPGLPIMPVIGFPDPEVGPVGSEALSDDALAQDLRPERPETGSTSGPTDNTVSGEGPNKRC